MVGERTITPVLRYRDPKGAAEWLCRALGFDQDRTSEGPDGQAQYISLRLGDCFVLVCPAANSVLDHLMVQPGEVGGANTQMCHVTVQELDAHCKAAEAAGARIELAPEDDGAGGRFYMCRDPEDHLWSIGTRTHGQSHTAARPVARSNLTRHLAQVAIAFLVLAGWLLYEANYRTLSQTADVAISAPSPASELLRETVADELARRIQAEMIASEAVRKLEQEKAVGGRLRQELQRLQTDLVQMRVAKDDAGRALAAARNVKDAAERSARAAEEALSLEQGRAKAALEANAALSAKAAQLETALLVEKDLRSKAEREATALREQAVQPPQSTGPQPAETMSAPAEKVASVPQGTVMDETLAPLPPDESKAGPISACALAVQGKVPFGRKSPSAWEPASLARLCRNAETSVEPAKCFDQLMRGQVDWGGGKVWMPTNALALCAGTRDASQTLNCFVKTVAADNAWRSAIAQCRFK